MANELEPNNTFSSADFLNRNVITTGNLSGTTDIDYYRVSVPIASELNIRFGAPDGGNSFINEWDVILYNSSGEVINARSLVEDKGHIFSSYVKSGTYYIAVKQQNSYDLSSENYQISYDVVYGNYNTGYEPNEDTSTNSQITLGEEIFGNLYATNDKDVYYFFLPSGKDTIKVDFVVGSSDGSNFIKEWDVVLYDSNLNRLDGKAFVNNGSFEVSTKSTGKFYIQVDQGNSYNLNQNNYFMTVTTSSTSVSSSSSSSGSSSSNSSTSVLHLTGEGDDGLTVGSSGDDLYEVSKGRDDYDGNDGYDTLYDIPRGSIIVRGQDATGFYTGVVNKKFIYINEKKPDGTFDDSYTAAWEVEGIQYEDSDITYNISSFNSTSYFLLDSTDFSDQNLNNNQSVTVDMSSKFSSFNEGNSISFSFSSSNSALTDQISQSGNNLTISSGSSGPKVSTTITVTASETSINRSSPQTKTETFTVTMADDDYNQLTSTREVEPNDFSFIPDPFDPSWDSDNAITSSHFNKDHSKTGNLSSIGDNDRFWVYLDEGEKIQFHFKPPSGSKSSYEILFVEEKTGEVVTEVRREENIVSIDSDSGGTYYLDYIAPSGLNPEDVGPQIYHLVIRAGEEESFNQSDYSILINDILNPTTLSTRSFPGTVGLTKTEGDSNNDTINGTWRNDNIEGNFGNDILYGNQGADVLDGGEGNDTLYGGSGSDDLEVSEGNDIIYGGDGIDILTVPDNSWKILRAVDVYGSYFSKGDEYIYVESSDKKSISLASGIEFISIFKLDEDGNQVWGNTRERDSTFSVNTFDYNLDTYLNVVKARNIQDINVSINTAYIDVKDYMSSIQYNLSTKYSIVSPKSPDGININNGILTIFKRPDSNESVPITVEAKNLKPDGTTYSTDKGQTITFYVTFAPDLIGDKNDNEIDGTSGNDIYNVTDGFDVVDGKSGLDTIVVPYNAGVKDFYPTLFNDDQKDSRSYAGETVSNYAISRGIDIDGSFTGTIGQEFITIFKFFDPVSIIGIPFLDENYLITEVGDKYINLTIATNFEKIYFENVLYDIEDFQFNDYFPLNQIPSITRKENYSERPKKLSDQIISDTSTKKINLNDYYINANVGIDTIYTIFSIDNDKLSDQISLDKSNIILTAGSSGEQITANVTVKGFLKYDASKLKYTQDNFEYLTIGGSDNENNDALQETLTLTFKVTMSDDDALSYSLDSSSTNVEESAIISFTLKSSSTVSEDVDFTWEVASAKNFNSLDETSDNDINPVSGTITILSGSSSSSFEVKINSDNLLENDESFKINILDSNSKIIANDIIIVRDVNNLGYELSVEKNENGPDLKEFSDTYNNRGTLNHTVNNEIIVLTGQAGTIRGLKGDDVYLVSNLITSDAKIQITDTDGNNTIEIPDNTLITKALFASNATKLTLGNNQEITITSADKFSYNVSGNISNGDIGKSLTYAEFANIFGIELSDETQEVEKNYYMKSDAVSESVFNIINISGTDDATIFATNDADEFRYEVNNNGTSAEGPYTFEIEGFDKTNDKLVLVNKTGNDILTTQDFDAKDNVEVTSDGIVGTQILFAPDSSGQSGKLTIKEINEQFSNNWTAETYSVEIKPVSQLTSSNSLSETSYTFSNTPNLSKPILSEFNSSTSNGVLNYSDQNDIIILNGSGKTAAGKSGDDLYIISDLIPKNGKIQITDTIGSNIIQIPDNTYIDDTLFTKNATRLTLKDGREVTISNADEFTYNLGANITAGDEGLDLSYQEFASAFGVEDVLSLSSSVNGTIVDQYII